MTIRNLRNDEIEVRVKKITENGAILLPYKTARTDMTILDETFSPENWECDYKEIKGNLFCGITVHFSDGKSITKWDCGIESREDGDGNEKKGEASDSFKRAGFKWGIGRELYSAPFIFIPVCNFNLQKNTKNNKDIYFTYDTFSVKEIKTENGIIVDLVIKNDKTNKVVFAMKSNPQQDEKERKEKLLRRYTELINTKDENGIPIYDKSWIKKWDDMLRKDGLTKTILAIEKNLKGE